MIPKYVGICEKFLAVNLWLESHKCLWKVVSLLTAKNNNNKLHSLSLSLSLSLYYRKSCPFDESERARTNERKRWLNFVSNWKQLHTYDEPVTSHNTRTDDRGLRLCRGEREERVGQRRGHWLRLLHRDRASSRLRTVSMALMHISTWSTNCFFFKNVSQLTNVWFITSRSNMPLQIVVQDDDDDNSVIEQLKSPEKMLQKYT